MEAEANHYTRMSRATGAAASRASEEELYAAEMEEWDGSDGKSDDSERDGES